MSAIVLSTGFYGRLEVCEETRQLLEDRGVSLHVLKTEEAVTLFNRLQETERVGGLFHSTC